MTARRSRPNPADFPGADKFIPDSRSLRVLREAANECRGCPLYREATQAVFGEGPRRARVMMVGEVPGDREDLAGHVFVGPAGKLLDQGLAAVGIAREDVYLTNAVKHFKYTQRGKRRIHDKPTRYETRACRPWLDVELEIVKPEVIVTLGALAAQELFGLDFRVTLSRGKVIETPLARHAIATVHPASVLRAPDSASREKNKLMFFADLAKIAECLKSL